MKAKEIVIKTLEENGIKEGEKVLVDAIEIVEKVLVALKDADETIVKVSAPIAKEILEKFKPELTKLADLNHDGVIG